MIECSMPGRAGAPASATGAFGGSGMRNSATITPMKLSASKTKAAATPKALISRPAGAGPAICVNTVEPCIRALAGWSCSACTSVGISAGPAGKEKASATPKRKVNA
jgi:hypothetical protein